MANPKWFTPKDNPVTNTGTFVELNNWKNGGQVHDIDRIIKD